MFFLGGAAALASHFMLQTHPTDAEFHSLSFGLLATGTIYCVLMALCFWSAWVLGKQIRKAVAVAWVTLLVVAAAECWSLYQDIVTGVSAGGVIEFIVVGILLAIVLKHLIQSRYEAVA
ncbi:MAG: hypothetical protein ACREDS_04300 [Limisphaerales bacterium]